MTTKKHLFQPGTSGNPAGRPPGATSKLRQALQEQAGAVLDALIQNALSGDTAAQRAILDKILPSMKSVAPSVALELGDGSLVERAEKILDATGRGEVPPDVAGVLVQSIAGMAKVKEIAELEQRLENLERIMGDKKP